MRASAFAKEIFVARNALEASLDSSAVRASVSIIGTARSTIGAIEASHHLEAGLVVGADHDAVGLEGVPNRVPFTEELGVGHDAEPESGALPRDREAEPIGRAGRHRRLLGDHHPRRRVLRDIPAHGLDGRQAGVTCGGRRPPDADEQTSASRTAPRGIGQEVEAAGLGLLGDEDVEVRLVEGGLALLGQLDLGPVEVHGDHVVAQLRERGGRHQPDVSRADDADPHRRKHRSEPDRRPRAPA